MNKFDRRQNFAPPASRMGRQHTAISGESDERHPPASAPHAISLESLTPAIVPGEDISQVRDLSLTCDASTVVRVRGLTDAARHALLRLLCGAVEPAHGVYRLAGRDFWALSAPQRVATRLRCTGSSLRPSSLLPHLTAQENVALSRLVNDLSAPDAMEIALTELDLLGAADVAGRLPSALSNEERRLTSLAKAFAHRPSLLLCEFPEEGLSRRAVANLRWRLWQAAHRDKACIMLFTESPALADLATTTLYF